MAERVNLDRSSQHTACRLYTQQRKSKRSSESTLGPGIIPFPPDVRSRVSQRGGTPLSHRVKVHKASVYFDQTETVVAMVVAILWTDHLLSPLGTTVKHVGFE